MYAFATSNVTRIKFPTPVICRGLKGKAVASIAAVASCRTVAPHHTVFYEGDPANNVYEVVRGTLKLFKLLPDGRRQITGFLSPGHLVGVAHDECYLYTAEAITEVELSSYPRAQFDRLIDQVPGFARRLLSATCDELRVAQDQMILLGRMEAIEKVAHFLLTLTNGRAREGGDEIFVPMSRSDIGDYLGLTTETVSRTLTILRHDGVIALPTPSRIVLQDRKRLERLAEGETDEGSWGPLKN